MIAKLTSFSSVYIVPPKKKPIVFSSSVKILPKSNHQATAIRGTVKRFATAISVSASSTIASLPTLKSRLSSGEILYGLFLLSTSPTLAEIAGLAGYDFVVVDMEHGPGGISSSLPCLHALAATNAAAILRLPDSTAMYAKKALDLGPQGIMFPNIESPSSAADAVSYCRYPPRGIRGAAHPIIRASNYGIDEGYLENYEETLVVMVQVETEKGMGEIGEISAVDGVDCVQMGPLDLSASLGCLWKPGHKKVKEVLMEGERKVLEGGKSYLGGFSFAYDSPEELMRRGYNMVSGGADLSMFRNACVEDVAKFRSRVKEDMEGEKVEQEEDEGYWSE